MSATRERRQTAREIAVALGMPEWLADLVEIPGEKAPEPNTDAAGAGEVPDLPRVTSMSGQCPTEVGVRVAAGVYYLPCEIPRGHDDESPHRASAVVEW